MKLRKVQVNFQLKTRTIYSYSENMKQCFVKVQGKYEVIGEIHLVKNKKNHQNMIISYIIKRCLKTVYIHVRKTFIKFFNINWLRCGSEIRRCLQQRNFILFDGKLARQIHLRSMIKNEFGWVIKLIRTRCTLQTCDLVYTKILNLMM